MHTEHTKDLREMREALKRAVLSLSYAERMALYDVIKEVKHESAVQSSGGNN